MTGRRFPHRPEISPRPFDGDRNPFADDITTPVQSSDNPLGSPAGPGIQPFSPGEYEQTQYDRSARTLLLAGLGAAFFAASLVIALVVAIRSSPFSTELVYCVPTNLVGLSLSIPAWKLSQADWRAIEAGVLDRSAAKRTRFAWWMSSLATVGGAVPLIGVLVAIVGSMLS